MRRILLVWELGAGWGHLKRLGALAQALAGEGHHVTLLYPKNHGVARVWDIGSQGFDLQEINLPEPPRFIPSRRPGNYAEVLLASGYHDVRWLADALRAWRHALLLNNPDVVIFDFAPTALLAARDLPCFRINLGDGFSVPPAKAPFPLFSAGNGVSEKQVLASEQYLKTQVNKALAHVELPAMTDTEGLVQADHQCLITLSELDPYAAYRDNAQYFAPLSMSDSGSRPLNWSPRAERPKVFAYLKPEYAHLELMLAVLSGTHLESRVYIPGVAPAVRDRFQHAHCQISPQPFALKDALPKADFVICHGGHELLFQSIVSGVPVLGIPLQVEQLMNLQRAQAEHLALGLNPHDPHKLSPNIELMRHVKGSQGYQRAWYKLQSSLPHRSAMEYLVDLCCMSGSVKSHP